MGIKMVAAILDLLVGGRINVRHSIDQVSLVPEAIVNTSQGNGPSSIHLQALHLGRDVRLYAVAATHSGGLEDVQRPNGSSGITGSVQLLDEDV